MFVMFALFVGLVATSGVILAGSAGGGDIRNTCRFLAICRLRNCPKLASVRRTSMSVGNAATDKDVRRTNREIISGLFLRIVRRISVRFCCSCRRQTADLRNLAIAATVFLISARNLAIAATVLKPPLFTERLTSSIRRFT